MEKKLLTIALLSLVAFKASALSRPEGVNKVGDTYHNGRGLVAWTPEKEKSFKKAAGVKEETYQATPKSGPRHPEAKAFIEGTAEKLAEVAQVAATEGADLLDRTAKQRAEFDKVVGSNANKFAGNFSKKLAIGLRETKKDIEKLGNKVKSAVGKVATGLENKVQKDEEEANKWFEQESKTGSTTATASSTTEVINPDLNSSTAPSNTEANPDLNSSTAPSTTATAPSSAESSPESIWKRFSDSICTTLASALTLVQDANTNYGTGIYADGFVNGAKSHKVTAAAHATVALALAVGAIYYGCKGVKALYNKFADKRTNVEKAVELIKDGQYKNDGAFYALIQAFGITDGQEQAKFQQELKAALA